MDYKYNFTIIIPHKNIPELLCRCVDSIPQRNDIEIVIVDDNSDSEKVDFNKFPFLGEKNIKVIFDKDGKGAGHVRNVGLDHAEGEWLIFADADDFFFYSINKAMDDALKSDADIIYYRSNNLDSDTYKTVNNRSFVTNNSVDKYLCGDNDGEHFIRFRHPAPWGKIIRSELVHKHNIRFEEIARANDYKFSYLCGYYANKIEAHDVALYCITSRSGNLTSRNIPGLNLIITKSETDFLRFMEDKGLANTPTYNIIQNDVFAIVERMQANKESYKKAIEYIKQCGFSTDYINKNLKRIRRGKRNAKIMGWIRMLVNK